GGGGRRAAHAGGQRQRTRVADVVAVGGRRLEARRLGPGGEHDGDRRPRADEGIEPRVAGVRAEDEPVEGGRGGRQGDQPGRDGTGPREDPVAETREHAGAGEPVGSQTETSAGRGRGGAGRRTTGPSSRAPRAAPRA